MKILDVLNSPWAMQPEKLTEIIDIYSRHLRGDKIDIKSIEAKAGMAFENRSDGYEIFGSVAVIPVHGVIARRMNLMQQVSGGVSTELLGHDIQHALNNVDVESIILDIDSPGGSVDGISDVAEMIFNARNQKRIVGLANGIMASGAMWIGSAARELFTANDTTMVGSIGVVSTHVDRSKQLENEGIKVTEVFAGRFKRISSEFKPLSEDGQEAIQDTVDYLYSVFVKAIARNRGVDVAIVLDDMADGRMFIGQQAIRANLVDGEISMVNLIDDLNNDNDIAVNVFSTEETTNAINILSQGVINDDDNEGVTMPKVNTTIAPTVFEMTPGYVMENYPDIAEHFRAEGVKSFDVADIQAQARQSETKRIQSVLNQSMPGHESVINEMAFDGKTTGPEAAVAVLQAEKSKTQSVKEDLMADAKEIPDISQSNANEPLQVKDGSDSELPIEDQCKAQWKKDSALRAEFNNDYECYFEYVSANDSGLVRLLKNRSAE